MKAFEHLSLSRLAVVVKAAVSGKRARAKQE